MSKWDRRLDRLESAAQVLDAPVYTNTLSSDAVSCFSPWTRVGLYGRQPGRWETGSAGTVYVQLPRHLVTVLRDDISYDLFLAMVNAWHHNRDHDVEARLWAIDPATAPHWMYLGGRWRYDRTTQANGYSEWIELTPPEGESPSAPHWRQCRGRWHYGHYELKQFDGLTYLSSVWAEDDIPEGANPPQIATISEA